MNPHEADTLKTRQSLLSKVRKGDEDGWARFFEMYRNFIYSAARRADLAHEEASDVVQETMVKVQNYIARFVPDERRGRFRTWLRTIVRSRIADRYRRRKRDPLAKRRERAQSLSEETATSPTNRIPNPIEVRLDRVVDETWEQALLEEARSRAKAAVRMEDYQAYDLFGVRGLTAEETAASLGISPVTVRVRAFRVRQVVQRELRVICRVLERPCGPVQRQK